MLKRMRVKRLAAAVMLAVMILLVPAEQVAYAEETAGTYSESVPYMQGISVELVRFDLNPLNYILAETNKQSHIKRIEFRYDKHSDINYSEYEFVFDFTLLTQMEDGSIKDVNYKYVIDGDSKDGSVSQLDEILIFFDLKEDYFSWSFDYEDLVSKSPYCKTEKDLLQQKSYNTVVHSVDCYMRDKQNLNYGLISRFSFVWYEDFYKQNCMSIFYELLGSKEGEILDSDSIDNHKFAGKLDSDGENFYYDISSKFNRLIELITIVPEMLYEVVVDMYEFVKRVVFFFPVLFPFIPSFIWFAFDGLLVLIIGCGVWKIIKGRS